MNDKAQKFFLYIFQNLAVGGGIGEDSAKLAKNAGLRVEKVSEYNFRQILQLGERKIEDDSRPDSTNN